MEIVTSGTKKTRTQDVFITSENYAVETEEKD